MTKRERQQSALKYIRENYKVPLQLNGHVRFEGKLGTVVDVDGQYLKVKFPDIASVQTLHPTWHMEYVK